MPAADREYLPGDGHILNIDALLSKLRPMRVLSIETTGLSGSVAALNDDRVLATLDLRSGQRSAQSLAPAIAELCREVGWRPADVELIGVTVGPGSFTGLRVGVTTAKTLAYVTGAAVLGVDTLEVMAAQMPAEIGKAWSVFDAQRGELFAAQFERSAPNDPPALRVVVPHAIVDGEKWIGNRAAGDAITGQGLTRWREKIAPSVIVIDQRHWQPQATTVGQLAWRKYQGGERQDLWGLAPNYLRVSAAEEKLAEAKTNLV